MIHEEQANTGGGGGATGGITGPGRANSGKADTHLSGLIVGGRWGNRDSTNMEKAPMGRVEGPNRARRPLLGYRPPNRRTCARSALAPGTLANVEMEERPY